MSLHYKESGKTIRINVGRDITAATPMLKLLPEIGTAKEMTSGVTIPLVDVVDGIQSYASGQYIEYTTTDSDLTYTGAWKKKAVLTFSAANIEQTNYERFWVLA